jgi:molybdate transport system substrate-binding protein
VQAPPGVPVGTLVARGEAELGFQQKSELIGISGIDVLEALPEGVQAVTVFAAQVCAGTRERAAAEAFLAFLASPAADASIVRRGMMPARAS